MKLKKVWNVWFHIEIVSRLKITYVTTPKIFGSFQLSAVGIRFLKYENKLVAILSNGIYFKEWIYLPH